MLAPTVGTSTGLRSGAGRYALPRSSSSLHCHGAAHHRQGSGRKALTFRESLSLCASAASAALSTSIGNGSLPLSTLWHKLTTVFWLFFLASQYSRCCHYSSLCQCAKVKGGEKCKTLQCAIKKTSLSFVTHGSFSMDFIDTKYSLYIINIRSTV